MGLANKINFAQTQTFKYSVQSFVTADTGHALKLPVGVRFLKTTH